VMTFQVTTNSSPEPVTVSQEFDRSPEVIFIEEGNQRLGVRVKCKLYDTNNRYHGHGMVEAWVYPTGEMFVTTAAAFEDALAHETVPAARTEFRLAPEYQSAGFASDQPADIPLTPAAQPRAIPLGADSPAGRRVTLTGTGVPTLGLSWRGLGMEHNNFVYRKEKGAPYYYRWPHYLWQAYQGGKPPVGLAFGPGLVSLAWDAAASPTPSYAALFRLVALPGQTTVDSFVAAERDPVKLELSGGVIHGNLDGYNDLEGVYEVRKTDNPMTVKLPADERRRTVRVKIIALNGHGAVVATLDGQPVVPHLTSEGGIADDPLAPIREQLEGPADMALVTVPLTDKPQTLIIKEQDGVQVAYQTRDRWRSLACFSTKTGGKYPGFRFSLVDGRARNMRAYGNREWALTENLLTWFSFCGFTPEQMVDQIADFEVLKNGPDEAIFRYASVNANGRARSEYVVRVPADAPAQTINVTATFTVLERWPHASSQFFDVFPFRGVWPQDWWYDEVLWLAPDGRSKWLRTVEATYGGDTKLQEFADGGFFALYRSDRGNMVILTKNFRPNLPTKYVICGNYIDYHMELLFQGADGKPAPPPKGFQATMEYDLAVWGDAKVTREQLIKIGQDSIKAGRLVLPGL